MNVKNKLDLSDQPVIDEHCHAFPKASNFITKDQLLSLLSIGGPQYELASSSPCQDHHPQHLLLYRVLLKKLAQFLACPPKIEDILDARNRKAENFRNYLKALFADVTLQLLMIGDGYSEVTTAHPISQANFEDLLRLVTIPVARIKRVEPLIQTSIDNSSSFEDLINTYTTALELAIRKQKCVAFKSITAYRTGLDIQEPDETAAKAEFLRYKKKRQRAWFGPQVKKLREYLVCYAIEKSTKFKIPFQIHTGIGDTDIVLECCNPQYLFNLLKREEIRRATIVLVHSGYPYTAEAAYLTNAFPNVYIDLSLLFPFAYTGAQARLLEILELAPMSKIMYGSDGFSIPELHWLGAKIGKEILGEVFGWLVERKVLDEDEAYESAAMILAGTAHHLYRLP